MNPFKYLQRQISRLKIDLLTQHVFLAGGIPSIDNDNIIKTVSSNYEEVDIIFFERIQVKSDDIIVDVGCGKARVFGYLLYKSLKNRMIGYEINQEVAAKTALRLSRFKNVEIISENIFDHFPEEGNVFYLYHPFKEAMMVRFREEFLKIGSRNPVMLYNNAVHVDLFQNDQFNCEVIDIPVLKYGYTFKFAKITIKNPD